MQDIVIEIRGGVLVGVYGKDRDTRVVLIDWDELKCNEQGGDVGVVWGTCSLLEGMPADTEAQYEGAIEDQPMTRSGTIDS